MLSRKELYGKARKALRIARQKRDARWDYPAASGIPQALYDESCAYARLALNWRTLAQMGVA